MSDDYSARVNYKTQKEIYLLKLFTGSIKPQVIEQQTRFYRPKNNI